ncbi:MAG TPA: glycosyltransferase family 4 protein [Candidatus Saccharimonadales bacterium]|nr:glycosyltransferase family 4 protein [Candidatus Saccharimonadales bacterium]
MVTHYYPPHMGGIEMVAKQQAERLAALGHSVTVVTSKVDEEEHSGIAYGVRVCRVRAWNGLEEKGSPYPIFAPSIFTTLWHAISQADVVHVHDATYVSCAAAVFIARLLGKPVVLTQHVGLVQHPSPWIMRAQKLVHATIGAYVYKVANAIFTLNDRVEAHVLAYGAQPERVVPLANGVDTSLFYPADANEKQALRREFGLSTDRLIALFVGRFVPKKGFDKVLAAKDSSYQLVFAGGEANMFTDDNTVVMGILSQDELAKLYRAADVFVLPSEGEGFPLSIQEAMATGLPIVTAHDEGYARYQLDPQLFKMLHQPNEHSIRAAIKAVLGNDDLRKAMSLYSRDYANTHFAWERVVTKLEQVYDDITQGAAPA